MTYKHSDFLKSIPLSSRWNSIGPSIFSEMTSLVNTYKGINLGQGAPNFYGPQKILDAICHQFQTCHNQYSSASGERRLREQLSYFIEKKTGTFYDSNEEITITCGASEALFCIINAFLSAGDKVILFEPAYDLYAQAIANTGAEIIRIQLISPTFQNHTNDNENNVWEIDWEQFENAQKQNYKCIIMNTPHNPTGKVFTQEEILKIGEAALRKNAFIIADEVYENLYFEKTKPYVSVSSFPEFRDITVRISSAAKTFGFTGLKIGWATAPKHLTYGLQIVHQSTVFCVNPAIQLGLADCLADETWLWNYLHDQQTEYLHKRNILTGILKKVGFLVSACEGTFFLCANYEKISNEPNNILFAKELVINKKIACIPLLPFYSEYKDHFGNTETTTSFQQFNNKIKKSLTLPWVRFAFCKKDSTLFETENLFLRE